MGYWYQIVINDKDVYVPNNIIDNDGKIVWAKSNDGLVYQSQLDGSFIINSSMNEDLFDAILSLDFCDVCLINIYNKFNDQIVSSIFGKTDIEYIIDKCQIKIKPRFYDSKYLCLNSKSDEGLNICTAITNAQTVKYWDTRSFEFITCSEDLVFFEGANFSGAVAGTWGGLEDGAGFPKQRAFCSPLTSNAIQQEDTGWTFYRQTNTNPQVGAGGVYFDIKTKWFREIIFVPKTDDTLQGSIPPQGSSIFAWVYDHDFELNGNQYHKWFRAVDSLQPYFQPYSFFYTSPITWYLRYFYGFYPDGYYWEGMPEATRILTRGKRLNEILSALANKCGLTYISQFFQNDVNPVSGANLSNLIIVQKSDCIYVSPSEGEPPAERVDPATKGYITFNELMEHLKCMFNVSWYINDSDELVIEHIGYFRNGMSYDYTTPPEVGLDLTSVYPICLDGSKTYTYESQIPVREKFNFMESWNLDFIGADIDYSDCIALRNGGTVSYSASMITTDLDPVYLDGYASNEGFCLFHCDPENWVIAERGLMSNQVINNAHLSFANLHYNYWRYDRSISWGRMNGKYTEFMMAKKLKKQVDIQFPFCVEEYNPNWIVKTTLGDGEVARAEYSFKTGNIKVQLIYE